MLRTLIVLILFFSANTAMALSELETRDIWSRSVDGAAKGVCKGEDKRNVVKKIGYAAVLIVHNEVEEAESVLKGARDAASSKECKKAIEINLAPPGEGDKRIAGGAKGGPRAGGPGASGN